MFRVRNEVIDDDCWNSCLWLIFGVFVACVSIKSGRLCPWAQRIELFMNTKVNDLGEGPSEQIINIHLGRGWKELMRISHFEAHYSRRRTCWRNCSRNGEFWKECYRNSLSVRRRVLVTLGILWWSQTLAELRDLPNDSIQVTGFKLTKFVI